MFDNKIKMDSLAEAVSGVISEDIEKIDELSKKTLGNYIKHSKDDLRANASIGGEDRAKNKKTDSETTRTIANRSYGINKAVDKLTKEEAEQIEELSKSTLASYAKKATSSSVGNAVDAERAYAKGYGSDGDTIHPKDKKSVQREVGAKKAIDRLAKESTEMTFAEKLFEKLRTMKEKKDSILVPEEEQIDELKKTTVRSYIGKKMDTIYKPKAPTSDKEMNKNLNDLGRAHARLTGSKPTSEETELDETLGKDAEASDWIHDFVHSKDPKFASKSKEERKKQALAAYYSKKNESIETVVEDETTTDTLAGRVKGNTSKFVRSKVELDADGVPEDLEGEDDDEHEDEKEDKELISKMVKKPCLTKESSVLKKIREVSSKAHKNVKETLGIASRSEVHEEDEQLDEDSKLDQWLNSIGVNPDHLTREKKIGYARSPAFQNWQRSH